MIIGEIENTIMIKLKSENGCPICSIVLDYEFNLIAKLQYEITYNEKLRKEVANEGGLCDFHFRQFRKIANGKTNILFLKTIIEEGAYKKENFSIECRLCKGVTKYEKTIIEKFINIIKIEENKEEFVHSRGICFEHIKLVYNLIDDEKTKLWLQKVNIEQIENLKTEYDYMSNVNSYYEIDRKMRSLISSLIQKLTGRKSSGL